MSLNELIGKPKKNAGDVQCLPSILLYAIYVIQTSVNVLLLPEIKTVVSHWFLALFLTLFSNLIEMITGVTEGPSSSESSFSREPTGFVNKSLRVMSRRPDHNLSWSFFGKVCKASSMLNESFFEFCCIYWRKKNVLINKSKIVVTFNNCTTKANTALIPVIHPVDDIIKCTLDYTMHARYLNDNWMQVYTCHLQICGAWVQVKSMIEFESLILMLATYIQFPKF